MVERSNQAFTKCNGGPLRAITLPYLSQPTCRDALPRSEFGLVIPAIGESIDEKLGRVAPIIEIPKPATAPCSMSA